MWRLNDLLFFVAMGMSMGWPCHHAPLFDSMNTCMGRLYHHMYLGGAAAVAGFLGALFNLCNEALTVFRVRYLSRRYAESACTLACNPLYLLTPRTLYRPALRMIEVLVVAGLTTTAMLVASMYLGRCHPRREGQTAGGMVVSVHALSL